MAQTPLLVACENGHLDVVEFLLERGAGEDSGYLMMLVKVAVCYMHNDIAKLLRAKAEVMDMNVAGRPRSRAGQIFRHMANGARGKIASATGYGERSEYGGRVSSGRVSGGNLDRPSSEVWRSMHSVVDPIMDSVFSSRVFYQF